METVWIDVINGAWPVIGTLGGAFIGAYLTNKNQKNILDRQSKLDHIKEIRAKKEETFLVYNEFLRVDGEIQIVSRYGGPFNSFNIEGYQKRIRPILYKKFHLLHQNVVDMVLEIDQNIARYDYNEGIEVDESDDLCDKYIDLLNEVHCHMKEGRDQLLMYE